MLVLLDTYSATYALLVLAFGECVAIGWVYGIQNIYDDIQEMTGRRLSFWWMICWKFIDPFLIMVSEGDLGFTFSYITLFCIMHVAHSDF